MADCQCPKCGRLHRDLEFGAPPKSISQSVSHEDVVKATLEMAAALCGSKMTADNIRSISPASVLAGMDKGEK